MSDLPAASELLRALGTALSDFGSRWYVFGAQAVLVGSDPDRFFVPPYVGPKGWIGMRLDGRVDWDLVRDLVTDSYRMIAPKRLAALLDPTTAPAPTPVPRRRRGARLPGDS